MWNCFSFHSPRVVRSRTSFPSRYQLYQGQSLHITNIHCNIPCYLVHVPTALYELQTKAYNKYILYFRHANFFNKFPKLSFGLFVEHNGSKTRDFGVFWPLPDYQMTPFCKRWNCGTVYRMPPENGRDLGTSFHLRGPEGPTVYAAIYNGSVKEIKGNNTEDRRK